VGGLGAAEHREGDFGTHFGGVALVGRAAPEAGGAGGLALELVGGATVLEIVAAFAAGVGVHHGDWRERESPALTQNYVVLVDSGVGVDDLELKIGFGSGVGFDDVEERHLTPVALLVMDVNRGGHTPILGDPVVVVLDDLPCVVVVLRRLEFDPLGFEVFGFPQGFGVGFALLGGRSHTQVNVDVDHEGPEFALLLVEDPALGADRVLNVGRDDRPIFQLDLRAQPDGGAVGLVERQAEVDSLERARRGVGVGGRVEDHGRLIGHDFLRKSSPLWAFW